MSSSGARMRTGKINLMRVVWITHNYPRFAGDIAGGFLHPLAIALRQLGVDVRVVAPSDSGQGGEGPLDGVPVRRVRYGSPADERLAYRGTMQDALKSPRRLFAFNRLRSALRAGAETELSGGGDGAVVHAHWWVPSGLAAPIGVPMVLTCHGTDVRLLERFPFVSPLARPTFRRARVVTTVSHALAEIVRRSGLIFGLTHNYTGYPLVRQAREMIAAGELGRLRVVQVEYAQDWLTTAVEATGQKQAVWRTDPAQSGPAGSLGDIGTHAYNLACFVTGLRCDQVAADVSIFVPGRRLDDNVQVLLRFEGGARGMLWASQVATGNENHLTLRVYGEKAGLEWGQENPNCMKFTRYGKPPQTISRNGPGGTEVAKHASRIPSGHPEGYLEAFAQLYTDLAEQIAARNVRRAPDAASLQVPGIKDGVEGVQFISGVLESSRKNSAWVSLPTGR